MPRPLGNSRGLDRVGSATRRRRGPGGDHTTIGQSPGSAGYTPRQRLLDTYGSSGWQEIDGQVWTIASPDAATSALVDHNPATPGIGMCQPTGVLPIFDDRLVPLVRIAAGGTRSSASCGTGPPTRARKRLPHGGTAGKPISERRQEPRGRGEVCTDSPNSRHFTHRRGRAAPAKCRLTAHEVLPHLAPGRTISSPGPATRSGSSSWSSSSRPWRGRSGSSCSAGGSAGGSCGATAGSCTSARRTWRGPRRRSGARAGAPSCSAG